MNHTISKNKATTINAIARSKNSTYESWGQNSMSGCHHNRTELILVRSQNFLKNRYKKLPPYAKKAALCTRTTDI